MEYKPNDEMLKSIAESIPPENRKQAKLSALSYSSCPDYKLAIVYSNSKSKMHIAYAKDNAKLEEKEKVAGVLLNAAMSMLAGAKNALNLSDYDILDFVSREMQYSETTLGEAEE